MAKNKIPDLPVVSLEDVEIFSVGTWNDLEVTAENLQQIVDTFERFSKENAGWKPYLKIDHDGEMPFVDHFRLGTFREVWGEGDKLFGNIDAVPMNFAALIKAGACSLRSIELWTEFEYTNGHKYEWWLEAMAFFGQGLQGVSNLNDFINFYYYGNDSFILDNNQSEEFKKVFSKPDPVVQFARQRTGKSVFRVMPANTGINADSNSNKKEVYNMKIKKQFDDQVTQADPAAPEGEPSNSDIVKMLTELTKRVDACEAAIANMSPAEQQKSDAPAQQTNDAVATLQKRNYELEKQIKTEGFERFKNELYAKFKSSTVKSFMEDKYNPLTIENYKGFSHLLSAAIAGDKRGLYDEVEMPGDYEAPTNKNVDPTSFKISSLAHEMMKADTKLKFAQARRMACQKLGV